MTLEIRLRTSVRGFDEYWIKTTRQHPEDLEGTVSTIIPDAIFQGTRSTVFDHSLGKLEFLPIGKSLE
jgi:hypothetical protein